MCVDCFLESFDNHKNHLNEIIKIKEFIEEN